VRVDLRAVSGLDVALEGAALALVFGSDVIHPEGGLRRLSEVGVTLEENGACGPDHLYTIYMDVCRVQDHTALVDQ